VTIERRLAARLIKRVPMQITLAMNSSAESLSAETMNISKSGAYFATSLNFAFFASIYLLCVLCAPGVPCGGVFSFFFYREPSISVLFFFPQSSTNLHRLFFGISLTPKTARFILRTD
jgi:hypothetical protein